MKKKTKYSDIERTAYHEAAHAVVAIYSRLYIRKVSIYSSIDDDNNFLSGYVEHSGKLYLTEVNGKLYPTSVRGIKKTCAFVRVLLAGMISGKILTGRHNRIDARLDTERAEEFSKLLSSSGFLDYSFYKKHRKVYDALYAETYDLLTIPFYWNNVKRLAHYLLNKNPEVSGKKARELYCGLY
jgi:hypothetical protein